MTRKRLLTIVALIAALWFILDYAGLTIMIHELDYETKFEYPMEGDIMKYIEEMENGLTPSVKPYNNHNVRLSIKNEEKCSFVKDESTSDLPIRVVYLVKSSISNFKNRNAIRKTWGYEKRFADVQIRTVFLLGTSSSDNAYIQANIDLENEKHRDIVQGDFIDTYYNNTLKTLMGIKWAAEFCSTSRFYFFVDDDFYVSTRNLLRFLRNPSNYPQYLESPTIDFDDVQQSNKMNSKLSKQRSLRWITQQHLENQTVKHKRKLMQLVEFDLPEDVELYTGYVFFPKPHRHKSSKWYVSLQEYPYSRYPPYVAAGAYILSNAALKKFHRATYFVKKFRFDDVYLGIVAKKLGIVPFHCEEFWFYRKYPYKLNDFRYTIASHEFSDPDEMERVWNQQKQAGNA